MHAVIAAPAASVIVTVSCICSNGGQLARYLELHWESTTLSSEIVVVESATMIVGASFDIVPSKYTRCCFPILMLTCNALQMMHGLESGCLELGDKVMSYPLHLLDAPMPCLL